MDGNQTNRRSGAQPPKSQVTKLVSMSLPPIVGPSVRYRLEKAAMIELVLLGKGGATAPSTACQAVVNSKESQRERPRGASWAQLGVSIAGGGGRCQASLLRGIVIVQSLPLVMMRPYLLRLRTTNRADERLQM